MRWIGRRESDNIEDKRSQGGDAGFDSGNLGYSRRNSSGGLGQGISGLPISGKWKIILFLILIALAMGGVIDPGTVMQQGFGISSSSSGNNTTQNELQKMYQESAANDNRPPADAARHFVGVVLADTEDVWSAVFNEHGQTYTIPKMVLFSGHTQSGCGYANAATGPFYCPIDTKLYIDLNFFIELQNDLGASGDFAQAYVIAHEIGHHVQQLQGILDKTDRIKQRSSEKAGNALQVKVELQADCYAGIWAKRTAQLHNTLEAGDIDEAMRAASAVGDDRLQKRARGYVTPDSFTHGTAQQRSEWFHKGYDSGDVASCNTFAQ
jgi:uncharacterized protein